MKILYYIYQICIALPILLVLTILTAIVTIVGSLLGGAHFWGYYPGKIWSQLICLFLLIPVKIEGREKLHDKTSYIFVPNHQGSFDIFLIYGFIGRNFKWMMKKSLRKLPFVGKACESAGHIFVDRSGPKKVLETIRQAKDSLKDGVSLVVFPEGARTFTGHMGYFKKGAFQLADDLQLAVVPVTIDGSFEILPRTGKWIHRHRMILTIHDPIPPKGKGMENIKGARRPRHGRRPAARNDRGIAPANGDRRPDGASHGHRRLDAVAALRRGVVRPAVGRRFHLQHRLREGADPVAAVPQTRRVHRRHGVFVAIVRTARRNGILPRQLP